MSEGFRRKDRALSRQEALSILSSGEFGILSTVGANGQPYGVPVSFCLIGESIYFHCAIEGHKLNNISSNRRVSFCVVGRTQVQAEAFSTIYESAIVTGKASEVFDAEKQDALVGLLKKYSSAYLEEGMKYIGAKRERTRVFKVSIDSITGKAKK